MSSKYPVLPPNKIIKVMIKFGFRKISQKGSHVKYFNDETKKTFIIPMHYEIAKGTFKGILEQAGIDLDSFLKNL